MSMSWLYASVSVAIISLCGLLGVFVIPIMNLAIYQHVLQFFVALAIGTLCGDALLHLLPHALSVSQSLHEDHSYDTHSSLNSHSSEDSHLHHHDHMWKGLAVLGGLLFFFFIEKVLTLGTEWRNQRQRRKKVQGHSHVQILNGNAGSVGEKLCKHKYSSYPYCYPDIKNNKDGHEQMACNSKTQQKHKHIDPQKEDKPVSILPNDLEPDVDEGQRLKEDDVVVCEKKDGDYTVIIREHEIAHHGHSHAHGHVHSPPDTLSSVVWMVVLGDGLHNFTDGMAIGAAFRNNMAGGWSTAVAVFCHELPHELGDFAVLLKAGMSAKQAVLYNMLSSVLCFCGMCLGMWLGDSPDATAWVFAMAAGLFLYIALVDMFPELTSTHSAGESSFCQCSLQGCGLLLGVGIMLLIAYYEENLLNLF